MNNISHKTATDFRYIKEAGFEDTYNRICKAMGYYNSDPEICCDRFRFPLESTMNDVSTIVGYKIPGFNVDGQIAALAKILSRELLSDEVIEEMDLLRKTTNKYHHISFRKHDPIKDRYTCYVSMMSVGEWLVDFDCKYGLRRNSSKPSPLSRVAASSIGLLASILPFIKRKR